MADLLKPNTLVWYVDAGKVQPAVLLAVHNPTEERRKEGAKTLYDLCHGHSVDTIYKTEEAAKETLNNG
jgi:hypothetical protein